MRAVEKVEAVRIIGKMGGNKIQNHPDAMLMQHVHQIHKILRCPVAAGGREIPRGLVAPGAIKRMLHHRQQFHMRKPQVLNMRGQPGREFAIAQPFIPRFRLPRPGAQMNFVNRLRRFGGIAPLAFPHPFRVLPVIFEGPDSGCRARRQLVRKPKRVGLFGAIPGMPRTDGVFIQRPERQPGYPAFPDSRITAGPQRMPFALPLIEIPGHAHVFGIGRPDGKIDARLSLPGHEMGS